jgi:hypothetical protein
MVSTRLRPVIYLLSSSIAGTEKRGGFHRKEALSKMSPNSRQQLIKKQCKSCNTWNGIRATKCLNKECGVELENKAAEKRAAMREKKLSTKLSYKKAWDQFVLAAQVLHNSKPTGARISILAMKMGEAVDSVQTFGLGGGQRFVNSRKVQESFIAAMKEQTLEESKARRTAEKAARELERAAAAEQLPADICGQEQARAQVPATNTRDAPARAGPSDAPSTLALVVDGMSQFSEAMKKAIRSCLTKEGFDLETVKATTTTEFRELFPNAPFGWWKALEAYLSKLYGQVVSILTKLRSF